MARVSSLPNNILKNWSSPTVALERTPERPLMSKETKAVSPKGRQPWVFTGETDAEAEAPILWPPDVKSWPTGKDPGAGKDRGQEEKGRQRRWLDGIADSMGMNLSKLGEMVKDRGGWHAVHRVTKRHDLADEQQQSSTRLQGASIVLCPTLQTSRKIIFSREEMKNNLISIIYTFIQSCLHTSQVAQTVKCLPAEWVEDLGLIPGLRRSPGEKPGSPLQCSGLESPRTEEPGVYSPRDCKESDTTEQLTLY